ncbi:MAG: PDZ domain-containing protein, partial [Trebonia sp.]
EPGDSGGPLAGPAGSVIGMDTAAGVAGTGTGSANAGYAIPIDAALAAERQITSRRRGPGIGLGVDGFLGVIIGSGTARSPAEQRADERGVAAGTPDSHRCVLSRQQVTVPTRIAPAPVGALVIGVLCGTGAARAGLAAGDVITTADGHQVGSPDALTAVVAARRPGTIMRVTWVSTSGQPRTSRILLGRAPAA